MARIRVAAFALITMLSVVLASATAFAAPKPAGPVLSLSSGEVSGSRLAVSVGASVGIRTSGLDPARPVALYKGRLSEDPSFTGYEYQYYKGFEVSADGSFATDEVQDRTGTYRYQACQYYQARNKSWWVCSDYAALTVA